ncbi:MAG: carbon storage regulator [Planctomycetes bacterium]|nr:carbon storage regulator [Planctomycetota bacterium]
MLVLSRKDHQRIRIGDSITITVLRIQGNQVRIGIEAPRETRVLRGELDAHIAETPNGSGDADPAGGSTNGSARSANAVQELSDDPTGEGTGEKPRLRVIQTTADGSGNRIDRIREALNALGDKRLPMIRGSR